MIQRKQSIYFALVFLLSFVALWANLTFYKIGGKTDKKENASIEVGYGYTTLTENGITNEASNTLLSSTLLMTGFIGLICLFLFKIRKWQMILSSINFLFMGVIIYSIYAYSLGMNYPIVSGTGSSQFTFWVALPALLALINLLGYQGVKADEKLIRSIDRIR